MRTLIISIALILCFQYSFSAPVDANQAWTLAEAFYQKESLYKAPGQNGVSELTLSYTCLDESKDSSPLYYVFDKTNREGFILISGDDRTVSVLGYADNGRFDPENLPVNFKDWLEEIKKEIQFLKETNPANSIAPVSQPGHKKTYASSIAPLLGEISWNQGSPYYDLCPLDETINSYTGCVATAMAQIMRYHQWPAQGKGSYSYTSRTRGFELSVDFSQSIYDWENMTEHYVNTSTTTEKQAVAKLMYDCGVSVDMDYTNYGSGSYSEIVPSALYQYFDYDKNIQIYYRDYFSYAEWMDLIKEEVTQQRPVYISGYNSEAGHAFVCDGYDSNNLFHINWGWGGNSNGYFVVSALNPSSQGIGGSSGGYNISQSLIAGIQPPTPDSKVSYCIYLSYVDFTASADAIKRDENVKLTTSFLSNQGMNAFEGEIGVGLYRNNQLVALFGTTNLSIGSSNRRNISWNEFRIPANINNGTYELYPIYKGVDENEWSIIKSESTISNYLNMIVSDDMIQFFTPDEAKPLLSIPPDGFTSTELYSDSPVRFHINVENSGKDAYVQLGILFEDEAGDYYLVAYDGLSAPKNETASIDLIGYISIPPGAYTAYLCYVNRYEWILFEGESTKTITIQDIQTGLPQLSFAEPPSSDVSILKQNEQLSVSASIQNTGFATSGVFFALIYKANSLALSYVDYFYKEITLFKDETTPFKIDIPIRINKGNYYITFQYQDKGDYVKRFNEKIYFSVVDDNPLKLTELHTNASFRFYPNPTENEITVETQAIIRSIRIYSVAGEQIFLKQALGDQSSDRVDVRQLNSGIYFLQVETSQGMETKKFIKK
jgi:hypothetical protein